MPSCYLKPQWQTGYAQAASLMLGFGERTALLNYTGSGRGLFGSTVTIGGTDWLYQRRKC